MTIFQVTGKQKLYCNFADGFPVTYYSVERDPFRKNIVIIGRRQYSTRRTFVENKVMFFLAHTLTTTYQFGNSHWWSENYHKGAVKMPHRFRSGGSFQSSLSLMTQPRRCGNQRTAPAPITTSPTYFLQPPCRIDGDLPSCQRNSYSPLKRDR